MQRKAGITVPYVQSSSKQTYIYFAIAICIQILRGKYSKVDSHSQQRLGINGMCK